MAKKARIVKVHHRMVTYGEHRQYKTYVTYPQIRLSGRWLAACGFAPGQHIQITPGRQRLVIQLVHAPDIALRPVAPELPAAGQKPRCRTQELHAPTGKLYKATSELPQPGPNLNSIS